MEKLAFKDIVKDMLVLVKIPNEDTLFLSRVVETSLGHPSIPKLRLGTGHSVIYGQSWIIYANNNVNRTEVLLTQTTIQENPTML